jgi:AraC-like DNA-binding protein
MRASTIEEAISAAERTLGLRITVRDDQRLLGEDLPAARRSHRGTAACRIGFGRACIAHCRHAVGARAESEPGPFVHRCWKGLAEVVAPLVVDGAVRGLLFAGPWRAGKPTDTELPTEFAPAAAALPSFDSDAVERVGRVLAVLAAGLIRIAEQRADPRRPRARDDEIRRFIAERACGPVTIADLARALGISPSRARHVVQGRFGCRFDALVRAERVARAKALLLQTDVPVSVVGTRVGFADEYRFSRVFKAATGLAPGMFRSAARRST